MGTLGGMPWPSTIQPVGSRMVQGLLHWLRAAWLLGQLQPHYLADTLLSWLSQKNLGREMSDPMIFWGHFCSEDREFTQRVKDASNPRDEVLITNPTSVGKGALSTISGFYFERWDERWEDTRWFFLGGIRPCLEKGLDSSFVSKGLSFWDHPWSIL